jgi:hypothetical protein
MRVLWVGLVLILCAADARAYTITIGFDDAPAASNAVEGSAVPTESVIFDQYLGQGVLFNSQGGGLGRVSQNQFYLQPAVASAPNVAVPLSSGHIWSSSTPISAMFYEDTLGGTVTGVEVMVGGGLFGFSATATLRAFDLGGHLVASASVTSLVGAWTPIQVTAPGGIHSISLTNGAFIDDFSFTVPEPDAVALCALSLLALAALRR